MKLTIDLTKSVEENAAHYFELAKRDKKKLEGAITALASSKKQKAKAEDSIIRTASKAKKEWYEKFRWFFTTEDFLVIGGRDAAGNEEVIKKHAVPGDIVLHTDMAGSPFFVIKSNNRPVTMKAIREAADATASYSRSWKLGLSEASVFYVEENQVSKQALQGEHLKKGAFMIYGKTNYVENMMRLAIGIKEGKVIGGPVDSVMAKAKGYVVVRQGDKFPSDIAKEIKKRLGGKLDDIIRFLPSSNLDLEQ